MSVGLTATATRPFIDLAGDSPPPPKPSAFVYPPAPLQILDISHKEPPPKRRRVDGVTRRRNLKECIQDQVLPHVSEVVKTLPPAIYRVNDIAIQAVATLANSPRFRTRLDETKGYLTPQDEDIIAVSARDEVNRLASLEEYRHPLDFSSSLIKPQFLKPISVQRSEDSRPFVPDSEPIIGAIATSERANNGHSRDPSLPSCGRLPYRLRTERKKPKSTTKFFQHNERPYRSAADREAIAKGATHLIRASRSITSQPTIYHVDFTKKEFDTIAKILSAYESHKIPATIEALSQRCRIYNVPVSIGDALPGRTQEDISNFCDDLQANTITPFTDSCTLSVSHDIDDQRGKSIRSSRVTSLLLAREFEGNKGFGRMRSLANFQNEFKKAREDEFQVVAEYTNCAGDITAGSWVSNSGLICGTTAHSDSHNQQYNKPGNLLLCSTSHGTLRSFPHHRIPRPLVQKGENSTEAMRRSQDPWLYSSVVSSDYDPNHDLAFTSSFDKTVKVWKVDHEGRCMECLATWKHDGNVNFVTVARDGSGRVATAADSTSEAVRIYTINRDNIAESTYQSFSCLRTDADGSEKWAYFPATMQWGLGEATRHLLLVGYSPRSRTGEDHDIPEDKIKSGEITLWNAALGQRVPIMAASMANVFEVMWHPKLARFIAATTPCSSTIDHGVRTQVHIFQVDRERVDGAYGEFQTLDCEASDINELTITPNSVIHAYVTASCTDGKVYVWDTAQGDKPIHTLEHGDPVDECHGDREREDTGVKFTAWGSSLDRLYTGSSDGVIKVWNVRNQGEPFVRKVFEAPGPISFGAFAPDKTKLAIGDATGRVFILSTDQRDEHETHFTTLPGSTRRVRRPRPLIPHAEPAPPDIRSEDEEYNDDEDASDSDIADYSRRTYLKTNKLTLTGNPVVGAVQGPQYSTSGLFRREAHLNEDPALPLLACVERDQQASKAASRGTQYRSMRRLKLLDPQDQRMNAMHRANMAKDFDASQLLEWEMDELVREGAVLSIDDDWVFDYEEMPDERPGGYE